MFFADLNQEQAAALSELDVTAILPLGAVEVHGNHLPLGTDAYLAEALARKVEERLGSKACTVLPVLPYGQVWSLGKAPGSISISNHVLKELIEDIGKGLWQAGILKLAVINTHLGNEAAVKAAARSLYGQCPIKVYSFTYPGAEEISRKVCTAPPPRKGYFHACEIETSYMLYACPDKVDMDKAVCRYPDFPVDAGCTPTPWTDFMDTAVLGDATQATAQKGQEILEGVVERICSILKGNDLCHMS